MADITLHTEFGRWHPYITPAFNICEPYRLLTTVRNGAGGLAARLMREYVHSRCMYRLDMLAVYRVVRAIRDRPPAPTTPSHVKWCMGLDATERAGWHLSISLVPSQYRPKWRNGAFHRFPAHTREPRRRLSHGTPISHVVHSHMPLARPVGRWVAQGVIVVEQCTLPTYTQEAPAAHLRTRNSSRLSTRSARFDACCMHVGAVALRTPAPVSLAGHLVHGAAT